MDSLYFSAPIDEERTLCLAPITERRREMASQEIDDPSGYFLYELTGSGESARVEIIARLISEDAVFRLRDMLKLE